MNTDISYIGLALGLILLIIPVWFLYRYKTHLVRSTLIGAARMVVQLFLIGLYLKYLFEYNIWWVNLVWAVVMVVAATGTALSRTKLKREYLAVPLFTAFLTTALIVGIYFLGLVLKLGFSLQSLFTARYFIPIFGLLLGNMLGVNVVALNTYYSGIRREYQMFSYMIGNGASLSEATAPFISKAMIVAFNPCIANMAVMGLVAMPGTMIGQILGGSDPTTAIRYQILIVVITFVASMISLMITISLSNRKCFDKKSRLKNILRDT